MGEKAKLALDKLKKAHQKLLAGTATAKEELQQDGVIQRFEFTFELLWKALKLLLEEKGIKALSPKDVFQESFRLEWIDDEMVFLNMLDDRNRTSYIYDEKTSREIFDSVKNDYILVIKNLIDKIALI
ncbi:nucleotidyltransferase substrate binding protein [Candidatus Saganbacteria bacterium]|nr:nucleotidyltransferase substrate binding protein [Candidatus Saganbacteria bacterium]